MYTVTPLLEESNQLRLREHQELQCLRGGFDALWTSSPSGEQHRHHVVVKLGRKVEPMERILLQALLGSDLKREALSWVRLVNNDPNPTLFYEKKPLQLLAGEPNDGCPNQETA